MSQQKKKIRAIFRQETLARDRFKCKICGWDKDKERLDPHHITDRNDMPNGGYVKENGITLCPDCHIKAETFSSHKEEEWSPDRLYHKIGSNYKLAIKKSEKL